MSLLPQDHSLKNLTQLDTALPSIFGTSFLALSLTIIGEYIGMESCEDLVKNYESSRDNKYGGLSKEDRRRGIEKGVKKKFPPPISLLARTGNLPAHMPWILKRHYTSDGRLILTEEKVRHHEYFLAHRSNGRLTLQLVPLDDEIFPPSFVGTQGDYQDEVEEECMVESLELQDHDNDETDQDSDGGVGVTEEGFDYHEETRVTSSMETGIAGNRTPVKCLDYRSVSGNSSFIFGVPLSAVPPVRS